MTGISAFRLTVSASAIAVAGAISTPSYSAIQGAAEANQSGPAAGCVKSKSAPNECAPQAKKPKASVVAAPSESSIVVTGSRIRRPNLESPVPITSLSSEELTAGGAVNIGDRLNTLPAIRSTFSQANSTRFIGTAGVNVLDLRGLGDSRTLVLVNGKRHVTYTPGDFIVDVNTIPTDLIERVDVVTGGSSAVYGSDAVAGVVNFILKNNFEGLRLKAQSGISSRNDRPISWVSLTAGQNFSDGRGNVAVNLEYVNSKPLYFVQRPHLTGAYSGRCQFNLAATTAGEPPSGASNVPDQQFFCGIRNAAISDGGTVTAATPSVSAAITGTTAIRNCLDTRLAPGGAFAALGAQRCLNPGTPQGAVRILTFSPSGSLCEEIPAMDFRPFGSGNYIANPASTCSPGATLRDTGQLAPGLKRYTGNLLAHFDVSDALKPFFEAKFVRVDALQEGQPSFFQSTFPAFFGAGRGIRCNNPFLSGQDITSLQTVGRCLGGATSTETVPLARFNVDFGGRAEAIRRDTYRIVGGIQGDFNDSWHYEVSANFGHLKSTQDEHNDLRLFDLNGNPAGFLLATDAVRNSAGQIVCRINAVTVTDPACVPINLFGYGQPSPAALSYVNTISHVYSTASELDLLGFVSGDSGKWLNLWGGPIGFVLGAEHREERASQHADPLSASGGTFFNAFSAFDPPAFKVTEGFGELELPILRKVRFADELTIQGAARYSHYNTSAGSTWAWNVNGVWGPTRDIKFRANYSKSVRVPTLSDLYSPASQNFGFVNDPCDVLFINTGTQYRAANCAALGVPAGFTNDPARQATTGFLSGGNPNLKAETGKSLTVGAVVTPHWIPGLSVTVDYYRIRVEKLISVLTAQQIINACVDLPSTSNQYCPMIHRRPDFTFANPALLSAGINFAKQEADGIDFELAYKRTFANRHRLNLHALATYVIRRNNFIDPTNPTFKVQQLYNLGDPRWKADLTAGYGIGPVDFTYTLNYIGKQTIGDYANYFPVQGRPPQDPDFTAQVWYPEVMYHAVRADFHAKQLGRRKVDFYVGMDNVFDTPPPFGLLGTGGGEPYSSIGRYIYGGVAIDL